MSRRYGIPVNAAKESAPLTNGGFILAEAVAKAKARLDPRQAACTLWADVFTSEDSFDQPSPSR